MHLRSRVVRSRSDPPLLAEILLTPNGSVPTMERIMSSVIVPLSRLATRWYSLTASVRASQFSPSPRFVETVIGLALWSVSPLFWAVVIRFVAKHW